MLESPKTYLKIFLHHQKFSIKKCLLNFHNSKPLSFFFNSLSDVPAHCLYISSLTSQLAMMGEKLFQHSDINFIRWDFSWETKCKWKIYSQDSCYRWKLTLGTIHKLSNITFWKFWSPLPLFFNRTNSNKSGWFTYPSPSFRYFIIWRPHRVAKKQTSS